LKSNRGEFISGEEVSRLLNCSRTAIWKYIEELRKEGYQVEAVRRLGYRLLQIPDKLLPEELLDGLETNWVGRHLVYRPEITSTQNLAKTLAREKAEEGTVVITEKQTLGKGRLGREWFSPQDGGIWMSLILYPQFPPNMASQVTLLIALAVAQTIRETVQVNAEIKWPNDIYINGKKCCGILTELQAEADQIHYMVVGIGINANIPQFPDELSHKATSLLIEKGGPINRVELLQALFKRIETLYAVLRKDGFQPIKAEWESLCFSLRRFVTAKTPNGYVTGWAVGIEDNGTLILRKDNNELEYIVSADVMEE